MTDLSKKMIERADADGLPPDHLMRTKAEAFDKAADGFYADPQTVDVKTFMGHWARAKRVWCDYSGDELVLGL